MIEVKRINLIANSIILTTLKLIRLKVFKALISVGRTPTSNHSINNLTDIRKLIVNDNVLHNQLIMFPVLGHGRSIYVPAIGTLLGEGIIGLSTVG